MTFEKFEGPWNTVELLGCRDRFCGERLILDLFEYLPSGPDEDVRIGSETISGTHSIGLTGFANLAVDLRAAVRCKGARSESETEAPNDRQF